MLNTTLQQALDQRQENFLWRSREVVHFSNTTQAFINGQQYISFASNNYLGLAHHPEVIAACQQALNQYGMGSGSASLVAGYTKAHKALEETLAEFLQYPRVLLFSSGYLANIGIISCLFSKKDSIIADKFNHASLLDGCLKSGATLKRYPHCQVKSIEQLCQQAQGNNLLLVTEGLFGMDGTLAPLSNIAKIAKKYHATLLVDDAHGVGILGKNGRGSLEHHQLNKDEVPILVGTLGKAFGGYGAFVASHDLIIENLLQATRTYIYTTAIPPAIAAGSLASLQLIQKESWRREHLLNLIEYFQQGTRELGIPCLPSKSPIQPIMLGDNHKALSISQQLLDKGLFVKAIRPPTVPASTARLRISLTAEHTKNQIDYLLESLSDALQQH